MRKRFRGGAVVDDTGDPAANNNLYRAGAMLSRMNQVTNAQKAGSRRRRRFRTRKRKQLY